MAKVSRAILIVVVFYLAALYVVAWLPKKKAVGESCLPDHLKNRLHPDYLFAKWIPRKATSFCVENPPVMLLGNQKRMSLSRQGIVAPSPVPECGGWQLSLALVPGAVHFPVLIFAATTRSGRHVRLLARWDDVDDHLVVPTLTIKQRY